MGQYAGMPAPSPGRREEGGGGITKPDCMTQIQERREDLEMKSLIPGAPAVHTLRKCLRML